MNRNQVIAAIAALFLITGGGVAIGWYLFKPSTIIETAKPPEVQADGSVVVERTLTSPKAKPKQQVPKGAKVERIGSVTAQGITPDEIKACTNTPCPPVTIDTSLVRMPDGSKRVIVSSADGTILKGVDIPVETQEIPEPKVWAAGVSLNPQNQTLGIWIDRDILRVRVGLEVNQIKTNTVNPVAAEIRLRAGWTF